MALNAIVAQQVNLIEATIAKVKQFLDYCTMHEDTVLTYQGSDMVLAVHSDAGHLNEQNAGSHARGIFISSMMLSPINNGIMLNIAKVIKAVISSAAETEIGALYINAKEEIYIRQILAELGLLQTLMPIQTDNSTANNIIKHKVP